MSIEKTKQGKASQKKGNAFTDGSKRQRIASNLQTKATSAFDVTTAS
eukprot:CAMPEP_0197183864 /NCGR_PEP_ID=MMETSP1423-20130617/8606_1 /TAXON_ID=476441 /ORGANISM="Pseudo-nitzschia heimii, Strain UNC1101" /LENGTH=46 /DNA_ID= /DNA_START= /DNA_END= /DNA_ORIENTATION=